MKTIEISSEFRKRFPLSALAIAAAAPLLVLAGAAHSAGPGVDRGESREHMAENVRNFYNWTPAVTAADCPAGKAWQLPANGGVAFCAASNSSSRSGSISGAGFSTDPAGSGSGSSDFYFYTYSGDSGGYTPADDDGTTAAADDATGDGGDAGDGGGSGGGGPGGGDSGGSGDGGGW